MAHLPQKDKIYWHKGKGILTCIDQKEDKETEFADTISGFVILTKIQFIQEKSKSLLTKRC